VAISDKNLRRLNLGTKPKTLVVIQAVIHEFVSGERIMIRTLITPRFGSIHSAVNCLLLSVIALSLVGCATSGPTPTATEPEPSPTNSPEPKPTSTTTPSPTPEHPASPTSPPEQPEEDMDMTWGIPLGAVYELRGACADGSKLAQMDVNDELDVDSIALGLFMLGDQLAIVEAGLAEWRPMESLTAYRDPLVELHTQVDDALFGWLAGEHSPSDALAILQEQCPTADTLLEDLENLAVENEVPNAFLDEYRESYESMPSIFEFLK
jgi:hypothetical protein